MAKIVYEFVASGQKDVENAYDGIGAAATRNKKLVEEAIKVWRGGGPGGLGGGRSGAGEGGGRARGVSEQERLALRVAASQERGAAREKRVAERLADSKARIAQRGAEKTARDETRIQEKAEKARLRSHDKGVQLRLQKHEREQKAIARAAESVEKNRQARREKIFGGIKDVAGGALLGGGAAVAGIVGSATREAWALQETANRISINSRKSSDGFKSASELRRGFGQTAQDVKGIKSADVADAVQRFISLTGDTKTAIAGQGTFATVASATGTGIGDVAEAAASLSQQFDITGLEDMKEALAALSFQGKEGAFELKDAAAQFQRLAASGAAFGIPKGVQGVKTLGGLTQIARTGTGSAEQATTAVENLLTNLKVKQAELKGQGVNVYDKTGKTRDVRDLIVESIAKVGGSDIAKKQSGLSKIFGEQGIRAINPLVAKYNNTFRDTQGTDAQKTAAAMQVLRDEFTKAIDAPGDWADVQMDAAQAQTDASAQITAAWENIVAKTGDAVVPSLANLASKLGENSSALDPFIDAVGATVDVLGEFAAFLKEAGLLKPKDKPLSQLEKEQLAKANKEAAKFDKEAGIGPLTPEMQAKRDALFADSDATHNKLWGVGEGGAASKGMTLDDFVTKYMAAGGMDATEKGATEMFGKALQGENAGTRSNDWFQKNFGGENQAQQDVRHQFEGEVAGQKGAQAVDTADAQEAMRAFATATAAAAAAIAAAGAGSQQGTIFAGQ